MANYCKQLVNMQNYYMYAPAVKTGSMDINVSNITQDSYVEYFDGLLNILKDGIETDEVQSLMFNLIFDDGQSIEIGIFDLYFNLIMWRLFIDIGKSITPTMLFFPEYITQDALKSYFDEMFLYEYRDKENFLVNRGYELEVANIIYNRCIDNACYGYSFTDLFSLYLMNTINLKDDIDLCKENPRFNELCHVDMSGVPMEQVKDLGMKYTKEIINIISNTDHCLSDSLTAKEGVNPKQYREFRINKGTVPDGQGSVHPVVINNSFLNGGLTSLEAFFVESSSGRLAQIIAKCNVGTSGAFARILGLNNRDSFLNPDPNYVCDTKHFEEINMENKSYLRLFNGRYYRESPDGVERCLTKKDTHLVGKKLYFRSPMKCASAAAGHGICHRCYGKLAAVNAAINIGQFAAENLSAQLTQKQLSAKHLLESAILAIAWANAFFKYFDVEMNAVKLKRDMDFTGYTLKINNESIQFKSEDDDYVYNQYVTEFQVICPDGTIDSIYTEESDPLFLAGDLKFAMAKMKNIVDVDGNICIDMSNLDEDAELFLIQLTNDEFSATLNRISKIINLKSVTCSLDSNTLLQEFIRATEDGKLGVSAVHLEVILMNQLRSTEDILEMPNWSLYDQDCTVLSLDQALTNNPSITVSMTYRLTNVYYNPISFKKHKSSYNDLFFMEKPQEFFVNDGLYDKHITPHKMAPIPLVRRMEE